VSAPNVLLVVFDTARRDAVQPFGGLPASTPAVSDLALRGVAFDQAYSTSSWTLPAHVSMFSGLLPRRLGLTQAPNGLHSVRPVLESFVDRLLPAVLQRNGYRTQGWVTNHWVSQHAGFDLGFDDFALVDSERLQRMEALLAKGRRGQLAWATEGLRGRGDEGAGEVGQQLRRSIGSWDGQPTFWFVNLTECHAPYLPPRPWNDLGAWDRMQAALDMKRHLNFVAMCLYAAGRRNISAESFERLRHLYRRAISYMDDWLAGVLEALDQRGILDDTLVIVTSDHGENFGEDGLIAHGFSLDQRLIHVPLVMAGPGTPERSELVSLAELPAIIGRAAGLDSTPWSPDLELAPGAAVAQYDPMAPLTDPKIRDFAAAHQLHDADLEAMCATFTAATDGHWKLVVRDGREVVYDLEADPAETRPVPGVDAPHELSVLRQAVTRSDSEITVQNIDVETSSASPDELAAIERQMKLLGYM
jgi:arylsulfatase A-like enzyme